MKKLSILFTTLIAFILLSLMGCEQAPPDSPAMKMVKAEFAEGVFDNRPVCESVTWQDFTTDRGLPGVRYSCFIKGSKLGMDRIRDDALLSVDCTNLSTDACKAAQQKEMSYYTAVGLSEVIEWYIYNGEPKQGFFGIEYHDGSPAATNWFASFDSYDCGFNRVGMASITTYDEYVAIGCNITRVR